MALPPQQRAEFLARACGSDDALRHEVESLLAAQEEAGDFLGPITIGASTLVGPPQVNSSRPDRIGPYHILELLGVGGMGEVYKAEQRTPIKRTVAIKSIKLGFDSREVIARFESERQALARMDHANIAKVLDAGISENGQPYFVMEYVPGRPITTFCDDNKLSIKDRLLLFTQACEAISHAHTKALIHRDIKAANVLAYMQDGRPMVKVIDFGIAKALTGDRLTDATFNTQQGHVVGTYDSMSPEQADGSPDIDTRTDVYSLGVLLYELLTGAKPFDQATLAKAADHEIRRIIREVEPPRPSTRLSELGESATKLAHLRQSKVDALTKQLRSELEWIPLKAMRKERQRRYGSARALAEDIENYLKNRPLLAGPESRSYRFFKFALRHRGPMVAAASVAGAAALGVALYIRGIRIEQLKTEAALTEAQKQKVEAQRQEQAARNQAEITQAVSHFLTERVFINAIPERIPDPTVRDVIVRVMLDPAAATVATDFKGKPLVEAAVRGRLAVAYDAIGRTDLGLTHAEVALALRRRLLGEEHPDTLEAMTNLGHLLQTQGRHVDAERLYRDALERSRRVLGDDHPDTLRVLNSLSSLLQQEGKLAEAEPLRYEALERTQRVLGKDDEHTLTVRSNLATLLLEQNKIADAEPLLRDVLEQSRRVLGDDHPVTLKRLINLGGVYHKQGKFDEAAPLWREAMERSRRVLGDDHPDTLTAMNNMGMVLHGQRRLDEAESLYREVLQRSRRVMGDDHPETLRAMNNVGHLMQEQGKLAEAEPLFRDLLERCRRILGDGHPNTLNSIRNLASVLQAQDKFAKAEPLWREASTKAAANPRLGPSHRQTKQFAESHAACLDALGRNDESAAVRKEFDLMDPATQPASRPSTVPSTLNAARP
jgi:serine/threonine protein kinase/Tfp pilus assembly protein PilF